MVEIRMAPDPGWTFNATYDRRTDGDTALLSVTRTLRIRFKDCWCGETDSKDAAEKSIGLEADKYLEKLAAENPGQWRVEIPTNEMIDGDIADVNSMGRWVGYVYLPNKQCVGDLLIKAGLAARTKKELKALIEKRRKKIKSVEG